MHRDLAASAIVLVLAASCADDSPVAAAQVVPDTAQHADGTRLDTKPVANYGLDLLTGARCLMGASATCQTRAASADHMATVAGSGFSVSTSQVSIPANGYLNFRAYSYSATASRTVF